VCAFGDGDLMACAFGFSVISVLEGEVVFWVCLCDYLDCARVSGVVVLLSGV